MRIMYIMLNNVFSPTFIGPVLQEQAKAVFMDLYCVETEPLSVSLT